MKKLNNKQRQDCVVIVGLQPQSLALLQCLGRSKRDIHVFIDRRAGVCFEEFSRYGKKHNFDSVENLKIGLRELQQCYEEKLIIFITCAYLLTEIREKYRSIYTEFNVSSSPLPWIDLFSTKDKMYQYTEELGLKTMPYKTLTTYRHGDLKFPLILKRNIEYFLSFKTKLVKDEIEFDEFVNKMPDNPEYVLVQELVSEKTQIDLALHAYVHKGEMVGSFVVEEVRHCPPGISTYLKECDKRVTKSITNASSSFLRNTDYSGFIQIDYKYIPETDTPIIMDINTRTPASHSAFHTKFVNWKSFYASIPNNPCKLIPITKSIRWVNILGDIRANFKEKNVKGMFSCIGAHWDVFCVADPLPFILWPIITTFNRVKLLLKRYD